MVAFMEQANKQLDSSGFVMKAAFVTFNTESQAAACLAACPRRECRMLPAHTRIWHDIDAQNHLLQCWKSWQQ